MTIGYTPKWKTDKGNVLFFPASNMKRALILALALAGCTLSESHLGAVHEITEQTVTIRGSYSLYSGPAVPTTAMRAQAEAICPDAEYLSATPWSHVYGYGYYATPSSQQLYLFRC